MALAVLAGQLGLAPQQLGLQRHQIVEQRRAAELAQRGRKVAVLDLLPQRPEGRGLAGARDHGGHELGVKPGDLARIGAVGRAVCASPSARKRASAASAAVELRP